MDEAAQDKKRREEGDKGDQQRVDTQDCEAGEGRRNVSASREIEIARCVTERARDGELSRSRERRRVAKEYGLRMAKSARQSACGGWEGLKEVTPGKAIRPERVWER